MFNRVLCKRSLKLCTAILCGSLVYRNAFSPPFESIHFASSGYNYSRRFYPASSEYPDISKNRNIMARNLNKRIYAKLRDYRTSNGFTIDDAIQTGVDNVGNFSSSGCIAGDEETYGVFHEIFDKVIFEQHGYDSDKLHPTSYNGSDLIGADFDSNYVKTIRLRVLRNLRGYSLPPFCTRGERRDIESVLVKALFAIDGLYGGTYYSLKELNGEERILLSKDSTWIDRPNSPEDISCGISRDWPDARGIWQSSDQKISAFLNGKDHIVLSTTHSGSNLIDIFTKFFRFVEQVEKEIKGQKMDLMKSNHLGFVTSDPKNLGTALKISVQIKLPKLSEDSRIHAILKTLNLSHTFNILKEENHDELSLEKPTSKNNSILVISSIQTLGKSEVQIAQEFIDSINKLIEVEKRLQKGESIEYIL